MNSLFIRVGALPQTPNENSRTASSGGLGKF